MYKNILMATLGLGLATLGTAASAANCAMRDAVVERLQSKYAEVLAGRGIQEVGNQNAILEIWASEETGTFTVLLTNAAGISCVMAAGDHWFAESAPQLAELPKGSPS